MSMRDHTSLKPIDGALLPRRLRRTLFGVVCALLAAATYLIIVRGPALMFDLARGAMAYCF
jgi:hypothetical protein